MTNKTLLFIVLLLMTLLLIPLGSFLWQEQKTNEVIKIAPIEIEKSIPPVIETQAPKSEAISSDEIFSQFEQAVYDSKRAASNEEIAQNVLIALEKSMHKTVPLKMEAQTMDSTEINLTQEEEVKELEKPQIIAQKEATKALAIQEIKNYEKIDEKLMAKTETVEKVLPKQMSTQTVEMPKPNEDKKTDEMPKKVVVEVKPKAEVNKQETEKITTTLPQKSEPMVKANTHPVATIEKTQETPKTPKIILVSKDSHASLTKVNTLIENTHPEERLEIYNGSKAYVLDESAETEEISMTEEEFDQLPWSKTYGVIEESESFELKE